jgi:hypothetical protein
MLTQQYVHNVLGLEIKTEDGFVGFDGIQEKGLNEVYRVTCTDGVYVDVSITHKFLTTDHRDIYLYELTPGIELLTTDDPKTVCSITLQGVYPTYDIINSVTHTYTSNGIISHNCEFLSSDALLINSIVLNNLKVGKLPDPDHLGFNWFEQVNEKQTLLIGIDPATGSGSDVSSIEIFDFPSLRQIGEFRSNTTSSVDLYKNLKSVIKSFANKKDVMVYFSVENNGVGEGIISLYQNDENPPDAHFVSESGKGRMGMTTTGKSKIKACINLKELITKGKLQIASPMLLAELKNYVRKLGTYAAQYGSTDDSVSATLIVIRLIEEISTYEDDAFNMLYNLGEDETGEEEYDNNEQGGQMVVGAGASGNIKPRGSFTDPNDPNSFDPFGGI